MSFLVRRIFTNVPEELKVTLAVVVAITIGLGFTWALSEVDDLMKTKPETQELPAYQGRFKV